MNGPAPHRCDQANKLRKHRINIIIFHEDYVGMNQQCHDDISCEKNYSLTLCDANLKDTKTLLDNFDIFS